MGYAVTYSPSAEKQLGEQPAAVQARMLDRADELGHAPRGPGVVKLKDGGDPPVYRVRVGRAYRLLFTIDDERRTVLIVAVGPRKDIYRRR